MPAVALQDFFNCCEFALALVARAYPGTAPLIGGGRVLQLCDGGGGIAGKCGNR